MTSVVAIEPTRRATIDRLLAERTPEGGWEGTLSSSALSTATAVTALALAARSTGDDRDGRLVRAGLRWLIEHRNPDGGWGDTDRSVSNISTTALGWAALAFDDQDSAQTRRAVSDASEWLTHAAGSADRAALVRAIADRYGKDRTFSVPILTMCALAGRLGPDRDAWRQIPQLPFELAVLPRRLFTVVRLPVVSYALPALIAMGVVRHRRRPSRNPALRAVRSAAIGPALNVLRSIQPRNGGFLEAAPLTSFVAMSLIGAGHAADSVAMRALDFLRRSVRDDGSWPIDTNLATWVTTLTVQALDAGHRLTAHLASEERQRLQGSLLQQQSTTEHPYTAAAAGAWAWTDLPGGVPDADDTAGALLALRSLGSGDEARAAAARGITWLLDLQNRDGGIPTFCRGWGALPFDRSGADLTAHAVRAWMRWRAELGPDLQQRIDRALAKALDYLRHAQRADGAFVPLWFGNQHAPGEENLTYGTSRVLLAMHDMLKQTTLDVSGPRAAALAWLLRAQNPDGGWGGARDVPSSIEETALAVNALAACGESPPSPDGALAAAWRGAEWLSARTEAGRSFAASPIGFYFAKLWYYERLYPLIFISEALERLTSIPDS
jgi:squalene-hopene/tetraprenyl-beta-curcumene cyclase